MAQSKILSPHSHQRCQPGHLYPKTLAHKPFFHLHTTSQTLRHCGWQATGQGISPAETARASGSLRQIKGGKSARFRLAKPVQGRGERMLEAEQSSSGAQKGISEAAKAPASRAKGQFRRTAGHKAEARMALTTDWQSRHARHFSAKKGAGFG